MEEQETRDADQRVGIRKRHILASSDVSHIWDAMEALVADFSPSAE